MKTFKQFLQEKVGVWGLGTIGGMTAAGVGSYMASEMPKQQEEPAITEKPFTTPTTEFVSSPDEGKPPKVLSNNEDDAAQRHLEVQDHLIDHIKSTEGFRKKAYKDSGGVWTIGYGSIHHYDDDGNITRPVRQGDTIDEPTALKYISHHINTQVNPELNKHLPSIFDMKQNSDIPPILVARLKSFAYNVGTNALTNPKRTSVAQPLVAAHNEKDPEKRKELLLTALKGTYDFHKDDGVPVRGLLNRRHEKVVSVLSSLKNSGYLTDEEHEAHLEDARQTYQNYLKKYGWR